MDIQLNAAASGVASTATLADKAARSLPTSESVIQDQITPKTETASADNAKAVDAKSNPEKVRDAVDKVNEFVNLSQTGLEFSVDDDTDTMVVKVLDTETQKVIRQIPSEEVLKIAQALDKLQGLLVRDKA